MTYRYLEDAATADIAFRASGKSLEDLFVAAADATMNVMVEDLSSIRPLHTYRFQLTTDALDMLLFDVLQELIFVKDAKRWLLRIRDIAIAERKGGYAVKAVAKGEILDPERHEQRVDVKAVTLHQFRLDRTAQGWTAHVILDI